MSIALYIGHVALGEKHFAVAASGRD